ncbi:MAG: hypothetical protein JXA83_00790, partial [Acidimicrobiales bacterium]|nr:hypothetical protein [Acidimicrobiales bacterium]
MSTTPPSSPDPARDPEHEPASTDDADTSLPGPPPGATRVTEDDDRAGTRPAHSPASTGPLRLLAILVMIGGLLLSIAGVITWVIVTNQLSDEEIVVAEDADYFAGDKVWLYITLLTIGYMISRGLAK